MELRKRILEFFGITDEELPAFRAFQLGEDTAKVKPESDTTKLEIMEANPFRDELARTGLSNRGLHIPAPQLVELNLYLPKAWLSGLDELPEAMLHHFGVVLHHIRFALHHIQVVLHHTEAKPALDELEELISSSLSALDLPGLARRPSRTMACLHLSSKLMMPRPLRSVSRLPPANSRPTLEKLP